MGETSRPKGLHLNMVDGEPEGYYDGKMSWGTYMHGIFNNVEVVNELLRLKYPDRKTFDYMSFKQGQYEQLADLVDHHLDMEAILKDIQ